MSRGIMYYANRSGFGLDDFDESDFYKSLDVLHVDSVQNQAPEDAANSIQKLRRILDESPLGRFVETEQVPEGCAFMLRTGDPILTQQAKEGFFAPYKARLEKRLKAMTLKDFTEPAQLYYLTQNIDDTYSDAVYLDMGLGPATYTLMGFIRRLEPDTTYFFSELTVHMH